MKRNIPYYGYSLPLFPEETPSITPKGKNVCVIGTGDEGTVLKSNLTDSYIELVNSKKVIILKHSEYIRL